MDTVVQPHDTQARARASHALGIGIGFAVAAAVVALGSWERQLREQSVREAAAEPIWLLIGLYVLAGIITVVVLPLSRRTPWFPTAASVALLYYLLASNPAGWGSELPYPGWVPRLHWSVTAVGLMVGLLSATAVWSWWSYLRRPVHD
jgi:hypothetical protein